VQEKKGEKNVSETRLSEEQKSEIITTFGHNQKLCELLCDSTLEEINEIRKVFQIRLLMGKQCFPTDDEVHSVNIVHDLYSDFGTSYYTAAMIYTYGKIQGIRAERARRKGRTC
jgi:translation initiation factor 2 alpha subunit (eIF-2alpha)